MELYRTINNVSCRLVNWGNPFSSDGCDVILCITGNPGIIDFYYEFCSALHQSTELPLCLIGQAGHEIIPNETHIELKGNEHLFDLQGQIEHKLYLINHFIDKRSKLHLVGHSIGAWLILECIQKHPSIKDRIVSINLLFPTIQQMAVTKNGRYVNNVLRKLKSLIIAFLVVLNMLPSSILHFFASIYLKLNDLPFQYAERVLKYINPNIIRKVLFLAFCEMDQVTKLNTQAISKIENLVNIIYGENDGWVPLNYIEEWKLLLPTVNMTKVPIAHEFVLKSSEKVAEMVSNYIKTKSQVNLFST
ncbi:unnamed protein product [Chilo suppressalis]|uniref:Lipid droplet-associated hydrolase n=1 Tax=Chilo suppressalis TaxID=168631 RepID=A0ABN8BF47_CHISP|nr:unnamed protein product [Chilo suppressalis]